MLTDQPSGVTLRPRPLLTICTAPTLADGEPARFSSLPLASSRTRMLAGASAWRGVQAQIYNVLNIQCAVKLKEPRTIQRSEGKAVRVVDKREAL